MFCVPGEEEGNFKLLCHFFEDQVQVLRQEISSAKAIVRRLENLPQPNQVCSMGGSCHFAKASNDEFNIECLF